MNKEERYREVVLSIDDIRIMIICRASLFWTQQDLADKSGVSIGAIKRMESFGKETLSKQKSDVNYKTNKDIIYVRHETVDALHKVFESEGINIQHMKKKIKIIMSDALELIYFTLDRSDKKAS